MVIKKNRPNRRKTGNGRRTIFLFLLVLIMLCVSLFLLEWLKDRKTAVQDNPPHVATERHTLPSRPPYTHIELQSYTSSVHGQKSHSKKKPVSAGTVAIIIDDMGLISTLQYHFHGSIECDLQSNTRVRARPTFACLLAWYLFSS